VTALAVIAFVFVGLVGQLGLDIANTTAADVQVIS